MGKRLLRYYQPELLVELSKFQNQTVSLVMKDDRVHDGKLRQTLPLVIVEDKLGRKHTLIHSEIMELIVDFEATY